MQYEGSLEFSKSKSTQTHHELRVIGPVLSSVKGKHGFVPTATEP